MRLGRRHIWRDGGAEGVGDSLPFANRVEAGTRLGKALKQYAGEHPVVLGIPRGGIPVASAVADALGGELDVIVARKLGSPMSPELAIGAVTADGMRYTNDDAIRELDVSQSYLDQETRTKIAEAKAREERFRSGRPPLSVEGRIAIIVDDGLATGSTMVAAARSVRGRHPAKLVIAVPVGPRETCDALRAVADDVVCLETPERFIAVGLHYRDFSQTEDEEVQGILMERHGASTSG